MAIPDLETAILPPDVVIPRSEVAIPGPKGVILPRLRTILRPEVAIPGPETAILSPDVAIPRYEVAIPESEVAILPPAPGDSILSVLNLGNSTPIATSAIRIYLHVSAKNVIMRK
ncbi:hypothetical protein EU245_11295 [Lentibacillus lipolyticus]|nr:hypothetical protein EU245_11295 [Lentibacillus lipolyticus]